MNEIILIFVTVGLFFFGYEIRPWILSSFPENRVLLDLVVMAVAISTILIPLIILIQNGDIFFSSYLIFAGVFIAYLAYYLIRNRIEIRGKSRETIIILTILYIYIFGASIFLMILFAPFMPNIKI